MPTVEELRASTAEWLDYSRHCLYEHWPEELKLLSFKTTALKLTHDDVANICMMWGNEQEKVEKFGSIVPMGRPAQPVEIAPIYVLLASQGGSYITGEIYGATGGEGTA